VNVDVIGGVNGVTFTPAVVVVPLPLPLEAPLTPRLLPAPVLVSLHEVEETAPDVEVDALLVLALGCEL